MSRAPFSRRLADVALGRCVRIERQFAQGCLIRARELVLGHDADVKAVDLDPVDEMLDVVVRDPIVVRYELPPHVQLNGGGGRVQFMGQGLEAFLRTGDLGQVLAYESVEATDGNSASWACFQADAACSAAVVVAILVRPAARPLSGRFEL